MNVAFLDRDGTIIKDYPDKDWANVKYPEFLEGSIKTLKYIKSKNFETIIITNQYLRTRIHKRFNKVCKWEMITIDSEEETENS